MKRNSEILTLLLSDNMRKFVVRNDEIIPHLQPTMYFTIVCDILVLELYDKFKTNCELIRNYEKNQKLEHNVKVGILNNLRLLIDKILTANIDIVKNDREFITTMRGESLSNCIKTIFSPQPNKTQCFSELKKICRLIDYYYHLTIDKSVENNVYIHAEFELYNVNFNSAQKNDCTLMEYHSSTMGAGCAYVGFFDSDMTSDTYNFFYKSDREPVIIDINNFSTKINVIDSMEKYINFNTNSKNKPFKVTKLEQAMFADQYDIKHEVTQLFGEYIVTSNIYIPVLVLKLNRSVFNKKNGRFPLSVGEPTKSRHGKFMKLLLETLDRGINICDDYDCRVKNVMAFVNTVDNGIIRTEPVKFENDVNLYTVIDECMKKSQMNDKFNV